MDPAPSNSNLLLYANKYSRSNRIRWLLAELELSCQVIEVDLFGTRTSEHLEANPLGRVPTLVDGDLPAISESGAIVMYLLATYGGGRLAVPPSDRRYARYLQWMWTSEATLMQLVDQYFDRYLLVAPSQRDPATAAKIREQARAAFGVADSAVKGQDFIAGDAFSAADIMLGFTVWDLFGCRLLERGDVPHLARYLDRLLARPAAAVLGTPLSPEDVDGLLHSSSNLAE